MNPYLSKQDLLKQRTNIKVDLLLNFSNRAQETISGALKHLSTNLKDELKIEIDLSLESLSYELYNSMLEGHCRLLRDLGYTAHVSRVNPDEYYAIIHLSIPEDK